MASNFVGAELDPELAERFDAARQLDRRNRSDALRVAVELYAESVAARVAADSRSPSADAPARMKASRGAEASLIAAARGDQDGG